VTVGSDCANAALDEPRARASATVVMMVRIGSPLDGRRGRASANEDTGVSFRPRFFASLPAGRHRRAATRTRYYRR
jgi:hypothetical protein